MTENPGSMQVESASGKRSKIKSAHVLLRFEGTLTSFMEAAQTEAATLQADFLWECCGEPEFGFEELAEEYYGVKPSCIQSAATAISLHAAPMYFYRKGKGRYKAAPEESLKAALASQERKRLQTEKIVEYVALLTAFKLPLEFTHHLDMLLYAPDKNALEWKALEEASATTHLSHLKLLETCGAIPSIHDYHLGAFLREYFPDGTGFSAVAAVTVPSLPWADVEAFSIDDATTTEIDDAFSVLQLANGNARVGIHIAAPSLGVLPDSELDVVALKRLSTVYMPGNKITMLPQAAIQPFSLKAGEVRPALSLYLEIAPDFSIVAHDSRVESVKIADNLRHDELEPIFNEETIVNPSSPLGRGAGGEGSINSGEGVFAYWERLLLLFNLAESLEKARGKYDPNRPPQMDYNFYVVDGKVGITERRRGSPVDKLVAELMIYANAHWGGLLRDANIPGIYRAQMGGKVYMTVKAEPHQGLGVAQYAWSTSPLRRAVDLVNQRQVMALLNGTEPAYPQNSDQLTTIMRDFDITYNAYSEFQQRMERYWCLQYLIQEDVQEIGATVWRENLVRLDGMPYITKVPSLPETPVGAQVRLKIERVDTLLMELGCKFIGRVDAPENSP